MTITILLNTGGRGITFFEFEYDTAKLEKAYEYEARTVEPDLDFCNAVYYKFNMDHPVDYQNRSLSVGDVIKLEDENGVRYYAVENFGFVELHFHGVIKQIIERSKKVESSAK